MVKLGRFLLFILDIAPDKITPAAIIIDISKNNKDIPKSNKKKKPKFILETGLNIPGKKINIKPFYYRFRTNANK